MNCKRNWKNNHSYTDNIKNDTKEVLNELNCSIPIVRDTNKAVEHFDFWDYNCGGFAVGTFDWLMFENDELDIFHSNNSKRNQKRALFNTAKELKCIYNLRPIKKLSDVKPNEYLIGFRISNSDFHFIRRMSDGTWLHKPGHSNIRVMDNKEVFSIWSSERWDGGYNSKICWFANKIDKG